MAGLQVRALHCRLFLCCTLLCTLRSTCSSACLLAVVHGLASATILSHLSRPVLPPNPCLPFPQPFPSSPASHPPTLCLAGMRALPLRCRCPTRCSPPMRCCAPPCWSCCAPLGWALLPAEHAAHAARAALVLRQLSRPSLQDPWRTSHCRRRLADVPPGCARCCTQRRCACVRLLPAGRPRRTYPMPAAAHYAHPTSKIRAPSCRRRHSFLFFLPAHPGMDGCPVC